MALKESTDTNADVDADADTDFFDNIKPYAPSYDAYTNAGAFMLDGTRCRVNVVRPLSPMGAWCDKPAHANECEFHYLLRIDTPLRGRARRHNTGLVMPERLSAYTDRMVALVRALREVNPRVTSDGSLVVPGGNPRQHG